MDAKSECLSTINSLLSTTAIESVLPTDCTPSWSTLSPKLSTKSLINALSGWTLQMLRLLSLAEATTGLMATSTNYLRHSCTLISYRKAGSLVILKLLLCRNTLRRIRKLQGLWFKK